MVVRLVFIAVVVFWPHDARTADVIEKQDAEKPPEVFRVFSEDGSESLSAVCSPKARSTGKDVLGDITCRFTRVRFQLPSESERLAGRTLEEEVQKNSRLAAEYRKDPATFKAHYDEAMRSLRSDVCSEKGSKQLQSRASALDNGSKRKQLLESMLEACSKGGNFSSVFWESLYEVQHATCEAWVDHFSLDFKRIDDGRWHQERKGFNEETIVYYLVAVYGYSLWSLREEKFSLEGFEHTVWDWNNWDSYELPAQCRFISHRQVQYEF